MNKINTEKSKVPNKQIMEFYARQAEMEREKNESQKKVMDQQLAKVTGGKNIIFSNKP